MHDGPEGGDAPDPQFHPQGATLGHKSCMRVVLTPHIAGRTMTRVMQPLRRPRLKSNDSGGDHDSTGPDVPRCGFAHVRALTKAAKSTNGAPGCDFAGRKQ